MEMADCHVSANNYLRTLNDGRATVRCRLGDRYSGTGRRRAVEPVMTGRRSAAILR